MGRKVLPRILAGVDDDHGARDGPWRHRASRRMGLLGNRRRRCAAAGGGARIDP